LKNFGIADEIIAEPEGGAHKDYDAAAANLKAALKKELTPLKRMSGKALREQRYHKFRQMGVFFEESVEA